MPLADLCRCLLSTPITDVRIIEVGIPSLASKLQELIYFNRLSMLASARTPSLIRPPPQTKTSTQTIPTQTKPILSPIRALLVHSTAARSPRARTLTLALSLASTPFHHHDKAISQQTMGLTMPSSALQGFTASTMSKKHPAGLLKGP